MSFFASLGDLPVLKCMQGKQLNFIIAFTRLQTCLKTKPLVLLWSITQRGFCQLLTLHSHLYKLEFSYIFLTSFQIQGGRMHVSLLNLRRRKYIFKRLGLKHTQARTWTSWPFDTAKYLFMSRNKNLQTRNKLKPQSHDDKSLSPQSGHVESTVLTSY